MKKKIGIISCDAWIGKIKEDLMLQKALLEVGIAADIISWQDKTVNYSEYQFLILRSVWGYQNYYSRFKDWLLYLKENNICIYNNVDVILNNIRKDKQLEILNKYLVPHIPTTIVKRVEDLEKIYEYDADIVIKPIISGSGQNTYLISQTKQSNVLIDFPFDICTSIIKQPENGIMIQPFISGIKSGEYACIFIDGINTHNMLRFPGVLSEKKRAIYLPSLPENIDKLATMVSQIPEFKNSLYMRVDIVVDENKPYIMEIELAEPDLLIKYIDDETVKQKTLNTFVKKIERRI